MILFAVYVAAETSNAFQWAGQTPKLPLPMMGSRPYLICDFFVFTWVSPKTASWSVQCFLQGSGMWPTGRNTDRPCYSICSNGLHIAIGAVWPNNNDDNNNNIM